MPAIVYDDVLDQAQRLSPSEQLRLMEELAARLRRSTAGSPRHSILELQGLGKEIWKDTDVQAYIDQERVSWDG